MSKRNKSKPDHTAVVTVAAPSSSQLHLAIDDGIAASDLDVAVVASPRAAADADVVADDEAIRSVDLSTDADAADTAGSAAAVSESVMIDAGVRADEGRQSIGDRLRSAREARGISREEMSRRLRVSPRVIQDIESDQWDRLGAPVYVRGHLTSYARVLDVPTIVVTQALKDLEEPVSLALTAAAPAPTLWWGRYTSAATYIVLTLLLAIPVYEMVKKQGFNSGIPQVRALADGEAAGSVLTPALPAPVPAAVVQDFVGPPESAAGSAIVVPATPAAATAATAATAAPMMASMTPISPAVEARPATPGSHRIELTFSEDSWLELVDSDGRKLDYGMARAGEKRRHVVDSSVAMSIGNVGGVLLEVDGERVDLQKFARLNVARLKLFEGQEPTAATPR